MEQHITITGAREHNLKNITLSIPKNKLVVFTGLSGSGKSSLAFDTLYAEGQRRYVESLSSYARQFLGVMQKPDVDQIEGLSPAISIDQKTTSHNPRSTVGTITEIYDYMRLLFARVGHPHCPNCGQEISSQSIDQIVSHIMDIFDTEQNGQPTRFLVLSPVVRDKKGEFSGLFETLQQKGYRRVRIDGHMYDLEEDLSLLKNNKHSIEVVIDRGVVSKEQLKDTESRKNLRHRIAVSVEDSLKLADGLVLFTLVDDASLNFPEKPTEFRDRLFSEKRACSDCGISIMELEPRMFSFNSPQGACPECNGLGTILKINEGKIIAPALTLSEGAVIPFARMLSNDTWWARLVTTVVEEAGYNFRKTAWEDFSEEFQHILLHGSDKVYKVEGENRFGRQTVIHEQFEGFITNLERRYQETDSDYIRNEIQAYMLKQTCHVCNGTRLTEEATSVHIDGKNIAEITSLPIDECSAWVNTLREKDILNPKEKTI